MRKHPKEALNAICIQISVFKEFYHLFTPLCILHLLSNVLLTLINKSFFIFLFLLQNKWISLCVQKKSLFNILKTKKMKKLVLFVATIVAVAFASCAEKATEEAVVEEVVEEVVVDSAAVVVDSAVVVVDSAAVVAE